MKQTAVKWLQEKLNKILIDNQIQQIEHLFEQAKVMHKKEITEAWDNAAIDATYGNKFSSAEQYYNETFKQQKP